MKSAKHPAIFDFGMDIVAKPAPAAEQAHTPTPWRAAKPVYKPIALHQMIEIETDDFEIALIEAESATDHANAAFIILACNAHAQLVADKAALVATLLQIAQSCEVIAKLPTCGEMQTMRDIAKVARAALAAAGEQARARPAAVASYRRANIAARRA